MCEDELYVQIIMIEEDIEHEQYNYPIEQGSFAAFPLNCIVKRAIIKWSNTWC